MTTPETAHARPVSGAPWLPRHYIPRPALWTLLDAATVHPVTVVVAPAGAGKTMAVAGWLEHDARSVDPIWYAACPTSTVEEVEHAVARAAGDGSAPPRLLVVDDAHLLPAAAVRIISDRLSADPDHLRALLLTRWDLPIPRLVPQLIGHLTVLRGDLLRLTAEESRSLMRAHAPSAPPEVVDAIVDRADGWCAALVLAARASATMQARDDVAAVLRSSAGSLADLVAGEVFAALSPAERHLLLCVAREPDLTEESARHLTDDPAAGEVLLGLESTGLLVTRVSPEDEAAEDGYRIHPLLMEVVRRRLMTGGDDVCRAHATVMHAAQQDLAGGRVDDALRRFVAGGWYDEAAALLVEHGPRMLTSHRSTWTDSLRVLGGQLESHPETWGVLARARWAIGDTEGARHWADRLLRHEAAHPGTVSSLEAHHLRLRRHRCASDITRQSVADALEAVEQAVCLPAGSDAHLPLALMEIGVAENWLGDLTAAEEHLTAAVALSRNEGMAAVADEAGSHLALTHFMLGREQACLGAASDVLASREPLLAATASRAVLARMLSWFAAFPLPSEPAVGEAELADEPTTWVLPEAPDDPTAVFWHRMMRSRLALVRGSVADALRSTEALAPLRLLPEHLRVSALMEEVGLAVIAGNRTALRELAQALGECGAEPERLWAEGVAEDVDGDLRAALAHYVSAAEAARRSQPPTAAVALTCAAQIADCLGRSATAHELLLRAVDATDHRRLGSPFLGWSRHGTRVGRLLADAPGLAESTWAVQLRRACRDLPGIAALFAASVATENELASVATTMPVPTLSPRELEVLRELARGSTYSDAATNLFVSENTVKTHVSSLYSKLSVSRRSEALAVARTLHLI